MSDVAICVENLGKRYHIGGAQASYKTLRESLISAASAPIRWLKGQRHEKNMFWALQDVSFEIKQGEAVGIIGRNGAGKSTLLKILSRITKPTTGRVDLFGRVGSLLEVGTGFHPELTGRDNIYLNGAILGMSRQEILRKFDEIVAFAEIEQFLDTPVKYYSSGMYVRLAFAVAAHLQPEILVVDEVLAVGDIEFQKKCLGKMGEVAKDGRTVMFVSHNLGAIKALCNRGALLRNGRLEYFDDVSNAIASYMGITGSQYLFENLNDGGKGNDIIRVHQIALDVGGQDKPFFTYADDIIIRLKVEIIKRQPDLVVGLALNNADGICVLKTYLNDCFDKSLLPGVYNFKIVIEPHLIAKGRYVLTYGSFIHKGSTQLEAYRDIISFEIAPSDAAVKSYNITPGIIAKKLPWLLET